MEDLTGRGDHSWGAAGEGLTEWWSSWGQPGGGSDRTGALLGAMGRHSYFAGLHALSSIWPVAGSCCPGVGWALCPLAGSSGCSRFLPRPLPLPKGKRKVSPAALSSLSVFLSFRV